MPVLKDLNDYDESVSKSQKEESASAPAILPKSVLLGKSVNVGDKIILTVDKIMEDEISVSYSSEKESEKPDEPMEEETTESPEESSEDQFGYD